MLNGGEVGEESVPFNGASVGKGDIELVIFRVSGHVMYYRSILDSVNALDACIVDDYPVPLEFCDPAWTVLVQDRNILIRVGPIYESNDVVKKRLRLYDTTDGINDGAKDAKALVTMLISIAPVTPKNASLPRIFDAWRVWENVAEASGKDDFAAGVGRTIGIGRDER